MSDPYPDEIKTLDYWKHRAEKAESENAELVKDRRSLIAAMQSVIREQIKQIEKEQQRWMSAEAECDGLKAENSFLIIRLEALQNSICKVVCAERDQLLVAIRKTLQEMRTEYFPASGILRQALAASEVAKEGN